MVTDNGQSSGPAKSAGPLFLCAGVPRSLCICLSRRRPGWCNCTNVLHALTYACYRVTHKQYRPELPTTLGRRRAAPTVRGSRVNYVKEYLGPRASSRCIAHPTRKARPSTYAGESALSAAYWTLAGPCPIPKSCRPKYPAVTSSHVLGVTDTQTEPQPPKVITHYPCKQLPTRAARD